MTVRQPPSDDGIVRGTGPSRYDLYLALLPVPLLVGAVVGLSTAVSLPYGTGAGALCSALVLGHGLFRDPPRPPRRGTPVATPAPPTTDDDP